MLFCVCVLGCEPCQRWYLLSLRPVGICGASTLLLESLASLVLPMNIPFLVRRWLCDSTAFLVQRVGGSKADVIVSSRQ